MFWKAQFTVSAFPFPFCGFCITMRFVTLGYSCDITQGILTAFVYNVACFFVFFVCVFFSRSQRCAVTVATSDDSAAVNFCSLLFSTSICSHVAVSNFHLNLIMKGKASVEIKVPFS